MAAFQENSSSRWLALIETSRAGGWCQKTTQQNGCAVCCCGCGCKSRCVSEVVRADRRRRSDALGLRVQGKRDRVQRARCSREGVFLKRENGSMKYLLVANVGRPRVVLVQAGTSEDKGACRGGSGSDFPECRRAWKRACVRVAGRRTQDARRGSWASWVAGRGSRKRQTGVAWPSSNGLSYGLVVFEPKPSAQGSKHGGLVATGGKGASWEPRGGRWPVFVGTAPTMGPDEGTGEEQRQARLGADDEVN